MDRPRCSVHQRNARTEQRQHFVDVDSVRNHNASVRGRSSFVHFGITGLDELVEQRVAKVVVGIGRNETDLFVCQLDGQSYAAAQQALPLDLSVPVGPGYSHSMVPGGLLVTSNTTRLISRTSLVMRVEMRSRTS